MAKKRGRPPREGVPRGETGRIKSSFSETERAARYALEQDLMQRNARRLAQWKRAQEIVAALLPDTRLGTPLGRMLLLGHPVSITLAQYEAGERLHAILTDYDRLVLGMSRDPRSVDLIGANGRALREDSAREVIKRARERLAESQRAIELVPDPHTSRAVEGPYPPVRRVSTVWLSTCDLVRGHATIGGRSELTDSERIALALEGLTALAKHWRLDEVKGAMIRRFGPRADFNSVGRPQVFLVLDEDRRKRFEEN